MPGRLGKLNNFPEGPLLRIHDGNPGDRGAVACNRRTRKHRLMHHKAGILDRIHAFAATDSQKEVSAGCRRRINDTLRIFKGSLFAIALLFENPDAGPAHGRKHFPSRRLPCMFPVIDGTGCSSRRKNIRKGIIGIRTDRYAG